MSVVPPPSDNGSGADPSLPRPDEAQFRWQVIQEPTGHKYVQLTIQQGPVGIAVRFRGEVARRLGEGMIQMASVATSGIILPPQEKG